MTYSAATNSVQKLGSSGNHLLPFCTLCQAEWEVSAAPSWPSLVGGGDCAPEQKLVFFDWFFL